MKKLNLFKLALLALMPLLLAPSETSAQIITNFAGGGATPGDGGQATAAQLAGPRGVCQDASGNTYIIEQGGNKLRKVATDGIITTIAGSSYGFSGDGGPAAAAQFAQPLAVAADAFGNLYIADYSNQRIRKINSSGIISTIAGGGASTADGVAATTANVTAYGLTTDVAGNVYVADATNRIRKINVTTGIITTVAGNGSTSYTGEGLAATASAVNFPIGVAFDAAGNMYIAQLSGHRVSKVDLAGIMTTVAGTGSAGYNGEGLAVTKNLNYPSAVSVDVAGNIYIEDLNNSRIRKVTDGIISTIAGTGINGNTGDGGPATNATLGIMYGIYVDGTGNIFLPDLYENRVRKIAGSLSLCTAPTISAVSPLLGYQASTVTITGNGFNTTPANNYVYFGATRATVSSASATSLSVSVPSGATYMPVTVTNTNCNLTAYSKPFLPTFDNSGYIPASLNFAARTDFAAISTNARSVAMGDLDGDGKTDMVVANSNHSSVSVYFNTSSTGSINSGSFAPQVTFTTGGGPGSIAIGDIDGDGKLDIVTANFNSHNVSVLRNMSTSGSITGSSFASHVTFAAESNPSGVVIADIDMDGKSDLLVTNLFGNSMSVFRNTSTSGSITGSSFASQVSIPTGAIPNGLSVGDLDGDGRTDVAVVCQGSDEVSIYRNTAVSGNITTGSFADPVTFATGSNPFSVTIGDIDADGKSDIAVSNLFSNSISIYRNTSVSGVITESSFAAPVIFPTGTQPTSVVMADMDGDGKPDMAVANYISNTISLFRNTSTSGSITTGSFNDAITFTVGSGPSILAMGDLDGDGKPELAASNNNGGNMSIFWNNPLHAITGTLTTCVGATTTLSNITSGGTWYSSNNTIAIVGSTTGIVTGVAAGTATISYSGSADALVSGNIVTAIVTVNPLAYTGTISGTNNICPGTGTALTATGGLSGGVWSSTNTAVATVSVIGVVTGIASGNTNIVYTVSDGCSTNAATFAMTVNPLPSLAPISGPAAVCAGSTISLSSSAGGVWSSSDNTKATVDASGVVTGITPSPVTISYAAANSCGSSLVMYGIVVNATPSTISGPSTVCAGTLITLTNTPGGGTWSSPDATVSVVPNNGKVTGITVGTALISYSTGAGCVATTIVSVTSGPGSIGGTIALCPGATTALSNGTTGGTWSSSTTARATIDASTGVVTALSSGVTYITYSLGAGCYNTVALTVNPAPNPITGPLAICPSSTADLHSTTTGGVWTSDNTAIATVNSTTGLVTSVAGTGTATISYVVGATCPRSVVVTVAATSPNVGTPIVCMGQPFSVAVLTNATPGGTWSSSDPLKVPINNITGVLKGLSAGTVTITYQLGSGCLSTSVLTVNPAIPVITGPVALCPGSAALYTNSTVGGTWSSSNTTVATVGTSGTVAGILEGTTTISYIVNEGCYKTTDITVNGGMADITGASTICAGSTTTLSSGPSGGTWSSGHPTATINMTTGLLTGVTAGTAMITYRNGSSGCYVNKQVSISAAVATITGTANICPGFSTVLENGDAGGAWSSSNPAVATVNASGTVTGISSGTAVITYMTSPACYKTTIQTIKTAPSAIGGATEVCQNATATMTGGPAGGVWSSSNTANATISTAGVVRGITPGVTTIQYLLSNGCLVTQDVAINGLPDAITGITSVCVNATTNLTSAPSGGVWTSSNIVKAAIDPTSGVVTGVSAGTTNITYTLPSGCYVKTTATTKAPPGAITGTTTVAPGFAVILYCTPGGGTWSSADPSIASFNPATGGRVNGVATGVVTVTYTVPSTGCFSTTNVTVTGASRPGQEATISGGQKSFSIFPNPSQGVLNVETSVNGTFAVFTIDGRQVASYNITTTATTLSLPGDLASGMYMCRFIGEDGSTEMVRLVYER